jgi:hypothetical protein
MGKQSETRRKWEAKLSHEHLLEHLRYEPETGLFWWLKKVGRRRLDVPAGATDTGGYRQIYIIGRLWMAHRLAWFYVHGVWPEEDLDHRDRDRSNNRIANLRPATRPQNTANATGKGNATGFTGVHLDKRSGRFLASIGHDYKVVHLGTFDTAEAAHEAYVQRKRQLHPEFS